MRKLNLTPAIAEIARNAQTNQTIEKVNSHEE